MDSILEKGCPLVPTCGASPPVPLLSVSLTMGPGLVWPVHLPSSTPGLVLPVPSVHLAPAGAE